MDIEMELPVYIVCVLLFAFLFVMTMRIYYMLKKAGKNVKKQYFLYPSLWFFVIAVLIPISYDWATNIGILMFLYMLAYENVKAKEKDWRKKDLSNPLQRHLRAGMVTVKYLVIFFLAILGAGFGLLLLFMLV